MAEFASKGVAGAGLGTGIAGLALGVLNSSNNGNGLLGGLLGGGNQLESIRMPIRLFIISSVLKRLTSNDL